MTRRAELLPHWLERMSGLHEKIVSDVLQLKRGRVWCHTCGHTQAVDSADCLRRGWPKHCGQTMSIDSSEERSRHGR